VGPGYFATLRIPILRGREFTSADGQNAPHVAIVNESFARFYFGQQDPIGQHIGPIETQGPADYEIIGIAKAAKYGSLRERTPRFWYIPYEQHAVIDDNLTLYVRTAHDPLKQATTIRQAIRSIDANVPLLKVRTLDERIDDSIATDRMVAICSTFFGLLAVLLAAIGLYGTMTYSVVKRTKEIGIRMTLGAQLPDVIKPVMVEAATMLLVGLSVGVLWALALGRFVASLLFELKPADPLALLAASGLMTIVAFSAAYFPARRAARIDPMIALHYD
jgi:predicted permease